MMKKLTLCLLAVIGLGSAAYAGSDSYSGKEMKQTTTAAQPSCEWYRDTEWDVGLWGAYAFTGTDNDRTGLANTFFGDPGTYDRFLGGDHAWGGGIDAKYFFHKYFGLGVEGFGLDAHGSRYVIENFGGTAFFKDSDEHVVGAALATLTLRYPIGCSRFAPYVWAGGGGIFGGHNERPVYVGGVADHISHDDESRFMGQFGGGLEVRITPAIGWINDFSWNVVDGKNNNFGMVRTGINIAF
jgi:opacity protein-like surface antigen